MSILGPMGKNGEECQNHCPLKCGDDEMNCYGGKDWNSCQYPDFCHPLKDGKKYVHNREVKPLKNLTFSFSIKLKDQTFSIAIDPSSCNSLFVHN